MNNVRDRDLTIELIDLVGEHDYFGRGLIRCMAVAALGGKRKG
jgi:hypothetical protein